VGNERILHHLVQMLELSLIKVRISNKVTLVHQMSKLLGFESDHESFLVFDPVVAFPKDLEIACARLDHLVSVGKTFILGQDHTPWDNFFRWIVLGLELLSRTEWDVDASTIFVQHVVIESKKCSKHHLEIHFERDKSTCSKASSCAVVNQCWPPSHG